MADFGPDDEARSPGLLGQLEIALLGELAILRLPLLILRHRALYRGDGHACSDRMCPGVAHQQRRQQKQNQRDAARLGRAAPTAAPAPAPR